MPNTALEQEAIAAVITTDRRQKVGVVVEV